MTSCELFETIDKQRSKVNYLRQKVEEKNAIILHARLLTSARGGSHRDISDRITELEEIETELIKQYTILQRMELKLSRLAERLPDAEYNIILLRHCGSDRLTFEQIAEKISYSWRHVMNLYRKAKEHLDEYLQSESWDLGV